MTHKYHFVVELKWKAQMEITLIINEEDEKSEKEKESLKKVSGVNIINVFLTMR
jgi:hypothetical protein